MDNLYIFISGTFKTQVIDSLVVLNVGSKGPPPFELPPIGLGLPPFGLTPIGLGLPPIGLPPFGLPPIGLPPIGLTPFGLPPFGLRGHLD